MGQENSCADQTHYCRHCLKHCQRPLRDCATENGGHLEQSKRFLGTNTRSGSTEDSAQQTCIVLWFSAKNLEFRATLHETLFRA
jgi:hypothetical protein